MACQQNLFGQQYTGGLFGPPSEAQGEIDLRKEMHDILFGTSSMPQRGHWVIYRRFDLTSYTDDHDEVYRSGVGGVKHPYTDTVVMTRRDPKFSPESNEATTPMGALEGGHDGYYFEYDFRPRIQDQIFELDWDDHRTKPMLSQLPEPHPVKFNIKEVYPWRLDGGRIEYWIAHVNKDLVNY